MFVTLYGTDGDSGRIQLISNSNSKLQQNFERGATDEFELSLRFLGEVTRIHVSLEAQHLSDELSWFVNGMTLSLAGDANDDSLSNNKTFFPCYRCADFCLFENETETISRKKDFCWFGWVCKDSLIGWASLL